MHEQDKPSRVGGRRALGMLVVGFIMLALLVVAYAYSTGPDTAGDTVLVAVRGYLSVEQKTALAAQLTGYAPEQSEEGITLRVFEFPATGSQGNGRETSRLFTELQNEIKNGETDLLLLDRYVYDMLGDERLFADLSEEYPGDPALSGNYLYLANKKPFATARGLEELPELYFALRNAGSSAVNKNAKSLERYSYQRELLNNIAKDDPPASFAGQGLHA